MPRFSHLHLHSDYSFLDGVGRSSEYASLARDAGHVGIALTDHGNLYGIPAHWRACEKMGVKPIAGCELYINDDRSNRSAPRGEEKSEALAAGTVDPTFVDSHLVVLCESDLGWKNLLAINHDSVLNGFYYRPRATNDFVLRHSKGLIATTACLGSAFSRYAATGEIRKLRRLLADYRDAFGRDNFFREVHISEIAEQKTVNEVLASECESLGIPAIIAADVHYACNVDAARQDEMIAVSRRTPVNDPKAFKLEARSLYFWSVADAYALAKSFGYPLTRRDVDAMAERTATIADRCNAKPLGDGKLKPPAFILDDGTPCADGFAELKKQTVEGFRERFAHLPKAAVPEYVARLRHELDIVRRCEMSDFYLVTADAARECRRRNIRYWTRGSGCASLVAAAIGVTPIDPIRFSLLFERFVDPSRPNAPDFDMDVDASRRDELAEWLKKKYGGANGERIARIASISTFGIKSAIRDVCFAHGVDSTLAFGVSEVADRLPPAIEETLAVSVPANREKTIDDAVAALVETGDRRVAALVADHLPVLRSGLSMVGRARGRSLHAAGYVVAPGPLREHLPIDRVGSTKSEPVVVSAWGEGQASQDISPTGLLKIDLLALETMSVVSEIVRDAAERTGRDEADINAEIDPVRIDFADPVVLREFETGVGFGLHQLAAVDQILAKYVAKLKPKSVDEIVAAVALYRPGSMDFVDDFLQRARGRESVPEVDPIFDEIARETYGILVYQEQIMSVLHRLGDIPLREAYKIIKAISKKDKATIVAARERFIKAASEMQNVDASKAGSIFDIVEKFAGYGFNKAHAASYGVLSYQTAKLRSLYPTEFWKAWLNATPNESGKSDVRKIELLLDAASASGVRLVPPLIGHSGSSWRYLKGRALLAPLSLVRGVGENAAFAIREEYVARPWPDFWSFLQWADTHRRVVSSSALEALAHAGAFGTWKLPTNEAVDLVAALVEFKESKSNGTRVEQLREAVKRPDFFRTVRDDEVLSAFEAKSLGFNFWYAPWQLRGRRDKVARLVAANRIADDHETKLHGKRRAFAIAAIRTRKDKKGRTMAFLDLATPKGSRVRGIAFSSAWQHAKRVRVGDVYLIAGEFDEKGVFVLASNPDAFRPLDSVVG